MKKILIFGGTQFLSMAIAKSFINRGFDVDIITRGRLPLSYKGVRCHYKGDRNDINFLQKIFHNSFYDYIVDVNVYSPNSLEKVINTIVKRPLKYIMCSTCSVFDYSNDEIKNENSQICLVSNKNGYVSRKIVSENILKKSGLNYLIIRPTYIYGINDAIGRENLILEAVNGNKRIKIPEKNYYMNFINVEDLAEIFYVLTFSDRAINQTVIAANEEIVSVKKYLECCEKITGRKANLVFENQDFDVGFPYLRQNIVFDTKKLRDLFDANKFTSFYDGMKKFYESMRN